MAAWLMQIFSDPETDKASFGRVFGGIVIIFILGLTWFGRDVPEAINNMFWGLVSYNFLSKTMDSSALLEWVKSKVKVNSTPS